MDACGWNPGVSLNPSCKMAVGTKPADRLAVPWESDGRKDSILGPDAIKQPTGI